MAQTATFTRTTVTTSNQNSSQTAIVTEDGTDVRYLDIKATINLADRLLHRFKITSSTSGGTQKFTIEYLDFSSSGNQTYTDGALTTPFTDAEADSITTIGASPAIDMDAIYDLAEA